MLAHHKQTVSGFANPCPITFLEIYLSKIKLGYVGQIGSSEPHDLGYLHVSAFILKKLNLPNKGT